MDVFLRSFTHIPFTCMRDLSEPWFDYADPNVFAQKPFKLGNDIDKLWPIRKTWDGPLYNIAHQSLKVAVYPIVVVERCLWFHFVYLHWFLFFKFVDGLENLLNFTKMLYRAALNIPFEKGPNPDDGRTLRSVKQMVQILNQQSYRTFWFVLKIFFDLIVNELYIYEILLLFLQKVIKLFYDAWIDSGNFASNVLDAPFVFVILVKLYFREAITEPIVLPERRSKRSKRAASATATATEPTPVPNTNIQTAGEEPDQTQDQQQVSFTLTRAERPLQSREELIDSYFRTFDAVDAAFDTKSSSPEI